MKYFITLLLTALILVQCSPTEKPTQWQPLFNGEDLNDWTPRIFGYPTGENFGNTFRVEDGLLKIRYDAYDSMRGRFGALHYNEPQSSYRLRVEYRFVGEKAIGTPDWSWRDSGVQFHGQTPGSMQPDQTFPNCLEFNFHGSDPDNLRPVGAICTLGTLIEINGGDNTAFSTAPLVSKSFIGDQWVTIEIDVTDTLIRHFAGGEEILSFSNPRLQPADSTQSASTLTGGYISLQSNGHPIDFRKIEILTYE
ncbi:MAG: DUF1080 domain-containing protein [Cyclobacteriaceae bacterium]